MAELYKYDNIASEEVTFKTAASTNYSAITEDDIGKLCSLSADGTAAIRSDTTEQPILGKITAVEDDNTVTVQTGGYMEVTCGETVAVTVESNNLGTYNGVLYATATDLTTARPNVRMIKAGTTSIKAVLKLS